MELVKEIIRSEKLGKSFYLRDPLTVARDLLGKIFVKKEKNNILLGRIVEVEAYDGAIDESAHSYIGKTKRNAVMFEEGGLLYVYFTYGVHFCANVVTGKKDEGTAVLLRAFEPLNNFELLAQRRFGKKDITLKEKINLTNGPGKICQAFGISREENGESLLGDKIYILDSVEVPENKIVQTTRIGIKKSTELPWRFYISNNPYVSRK